MTSYKPGEELVAFKNGIRFRATFMHVNADGTYTVMPKNAPEVGYRPVSVATSLIELAPLPPTMKAVQPAKEETPAPAPAAEPQVGVALIQCKCGELFEPLTAQQQYCIPECPARPRDKPAQRADAVTRKVEIRRHRQGERGPQGNPRSNRLRMNFTDDEIERLKTAAGDEHPAEFARRAINAAVRQTLSIGKSRTVHGYVSLDPDGKDWWICGWKECKREDVMDVITDAKPENIFRLEVAVPVCGPILSTVAEENAGE